MTSKRVSWRGIGIGLLGLAGVFIAARLLPGAFNYFMIAVGVIVAIFGAIQSRSMPMMPNRRIPINLAHGLFIVVFGFYCLGMELLAPRGAIGGFFFSMMLVLVMSYLIWQIWYFGNLITYQELREKSK